MNTYVWFNSQEGKYEVGTRIEYELLVRRQQGSPMQLLYKFNRLSSQIASKVVDELNEESDLRLYA